jgi:hypothetical protein
MSTAHLHGELDDKHWAELKRIEQTAWFQKGWARPKVLIRTAQIPWLGGSSIDLRRIYVDPRFTGYAPYGKVKILVRALVPAVVRHEVVEGILLLLGTDEAGKPYDYDGAHEIATAAEFLVAKRILGGFGLPFNGTTYNAIYDPFVKITAKGPWKNLPLDLNTEPYRQDAPGIYREMERQMLREQLGGQAA